MSITKTYTLKIVYELDEEGLETIRNEFDENITNKQILTTLVENFDVVEHFETQVIEDLNQLQAGLFIKSVVLQRK